VFEDLDANGGVEFCVVARQSSGIEVDRAKRQLATLEDFATVRVRFQAKPIVTSRD